jgi:hypothetical protein
MFSVLSVISIAIISKVIISKVIISKVIISKVIINIILVSERILDEDKSNLFHFIFENTIKTITLLTMKIIKRI